MEQFVYDEKRNLWYEKVGDYYLPCLLAIPEQPVGVWGKRRERYLKDYCRVAYTNLLTTGKLNRHLCDVDMMARKMQVHLTAQMAAEAGINEQLKAKNQMLWVQKMNAISAQVREIVYAELIYA